MFSDAYACVLVSVAFPRLEEKLGALGAVGCGISSTKICQLVFPFFL